jgi:hypothetical protein
MPDFVLDAVTTERYTYFFAFYGKDFGHRTGLLQVQHPFSASVRELHILIRKRMIEVLGDGTPACFHIIALASPEPIPCEV